jgi:uncharacterized membrane protein
MNIHPAFVHFPIALLTLYTVCELVYVKRLRENISWFWFRFGLLFFGTIGSFAAFQTGKIAASLATSISEPLRLHATFGGYTVKFFCILVILYVVQGISRGFLFPSAVPFLQKYSVVRGIWKVLRVLEKALIRSYLVILVALFGLGLITITGALGGGMVYGSDTDPMVHFIYNLFF